ncbi:hypothetical protein [Rhodopirellula sallentina]|uniref:Uncharacterized protein n=1 Tax=Rhodopirellula sallentina SM41 TaxID=1263870 RepID=M5TXB3_9BACT|nr:hypothetical protein [Rhodopirellula sallentina]EMI53867.1 hypothetical protein RSSM_04695 [Rhodopirellula sallentina SM41]
MSEASSNDSNPTRFFNQRVISVCPVCHGDGMLWECDEDNTPQRALRCEQCNCVGCLLDIPDEYKTELDQGEAPF